MSMDAQVAILTAQHIPWSTDDGGTALHRAVARRAAFTHPLGVDAYPLQRLCEACCHPLE
jgi:hypothetical protein